MIATLEVVVHRKRTGGRLIFGAPLFLVWLALAPIGLLALPIIVLGNLLCANNPFPGIAACFRMLAALEGTEVEFEDQRHALEVRVA